MCDDFDADVLLRDPDREVTFSLDDERLHFLIQMGKKRSKL